MHSACSAIFGRAPQERDFWSPQGPDENGGPAARGELPVTLRGRNMLNLGEKPAYSEANVSNFRVASMGSARCRLPSHARRICPGGFSHWYKTYRSNAKCVNRGFLVIINGGLLITLFEGAMAGSPPFGAGLLLTFSGILFPNGCWHLWAGYRSHAYSPGTIAGMLLDLPLAVFEYCGWIRIGRASLWTATATLLNSVSYPLWSPLYHRSPRNEPGRIGGASMRRLAAFKSLSRLTDGSPIRKLARNALRGNKGSR